MWKLQPAESGGESIVLFVGQEYVVGRKNCEILLSNDQSISRVHASLTVTEQAVTLKDSSKYGTFINGEKLETGSTITLQTGDKITFGVFQSKFSLEKECIVVCSSCVDNEGKASLSQNVRSIGGQLINSWTLECTHLVMPTVKVTIKTICALLCCRPIVKPEFFGALCKAVQQKLPLPKAERYRPKIDEPSLAKEDVDLSARPERRSLFKGKTFLFFNSKQMKRLSQAVTCGGGVSQLLDEGSLPVSLLESSSTCVVDMMSGNSQAVIPTASKKWVDSVAQILHRNGFRFITESEIGLAAIHASNQTYCNPCASIQSESMKVKPVIATATLSQNTAVDETALAAPSQNITAYVVNTELSQNQSRMVTSGISAVSETPEKRHPTKKGSASNKPSSLSQETSATRMVNETAMSSESFSVVEPEHRAMKSSTVSGRGRVDGSVKLTAPPKGSTSLKQSPQKQTALTNFFQPVGKKRPRESSANSVQSEAKFFRKDSEHLDDEIQQNSFTKESHKTTHTAKNQHSSVSQSETSLGHSCESLQSSFSKKRKEPEQDDPLGPEEPTAAADLEMSLEELESIMCDEMDEPPQAAANKKQRLESGPTNTINSKQLPNQQEGTDSKSCKGTKNQQSSANTIQSLQLDRAGPAATHQGSERQSSRSTNQMPDQKAHSSANKGKRPEVEDVKEEEVSFVVNSRTQNGISQHSEAKVKTEMQPSTSKSGSENNPELPSRLLQVHFKSLTVSTSSRSRPGPLQTHDPNDKNVKRFRKKNVPGLSGLPNIIGGSDLVAYNRSKNSELEEWLRQAAEEEKQNEREETLGDDLFRYNPRPKKK